VTGQTLTAYLRARILDPVGAGAVHWQQHPAGQDLGFSGLHTTTDTIARLGELYLRGGTWRGRRLLPADWVAAATRLEVANATPDDPVAARKPDWQQGYGFQFWMSRHGFRGDGAYGQYCLVLPEQDAVVAMTGQSPDMQAVLDAIWTELLPAFGPSTPARTPAGDEPVAASAADRALAERLAHLELATRPGTPAPPDEPARWLATSFAPSPETRTAQPTLAGVRLAVEDGTWHLVVTESPGNGEGAWELHAPLGSRWSLAHAVVSPSPTGPGGAPAAEPTGAGRSSPAPAGPPVAASGGWNDRGECRADLVFLETPHRLVVTCSLADARAEARWVTVPLHRGSLVELQAPRSAAADGR